MSFRLAQAAGFAPLLLVHGRVFPKVHWYDYLFDFGFFYDKSVDTEVWEDDEDEVGRLARQAGRFARAKGRGADQAAHGK